jgi:hypothetical protein
MFRVGDRVVVERDERVYPSRGTWPRFRGREGVVVALNRPDGEIGVSWETGRRPVRDRRADSWFRPWELRRLASRPEASQVVSRRS